MDNSEQIRDVIAPLTRLMRIPNNLVGILVVARQLIPVLQALVPAIEKRQQPLIEESLSALENLAAQETRLIASFPNATGGNRKTLRDHYASYPHYGVYWHVCGTPDLEQQWIALAASMFVVQMRLERRPEFTGTNTDPAYKVGLALRQLTEAPSAQLSAFLHNLPIEPINPQGLLAHFETEMHQLRIKPLVTGTFWHIGFLHRALKWFSNGTWDFRGHVGSGRPDTHGAARHGATQKNHLTLAIPRTMGAGDGQPDAEVTQFFEAEGSSMTNPDEDFSPPGDEAKRGELITVPPLAASAANRADRRALARNRAGYTAQAITMANQQLAITHTTLSGFEIGLVIDLIENLDAAGWGEVLMSDRPFVAAWMACRLFLSRAPEAIKAIQIGKARRMTDRRSRGSPTIVWTPGTGRIWLPVESPKHLTPRIEGDPPIRTLTTANGFDLEIPSALASALARIAPAERQLFHRAYETEFAQLLAALNRSCGTALYPDRVERLIPRLMAQLGKADRVYEFYFRGLPPNQHNPCVYSALLVSRLQALYAEACSHVFRLAGQAQPPTAETAATPIGESDELYVGSLHVPTRETVQKTVLTVIDAVEKLASEPGASFIEQHNLYTTYIAFFLLTTTGLRGVSTLLPASFDVDRATGVCFTSDKDNDAYEHSRIVLLHPLIIEQLDTYAAHVTRLRQYLALTNPKGLDQLDARGHLPALSSHAAPDRSQDHAQLLATAPTLFLLTKQGIQLTPTFPSLLQHLLGATWQLRIGALRHFVRSELLHHGVPGGVNNATLGHGERGEGPWDRFSSLPPLQWRGLVGAAINEICADIGFRVLSSPLLRGAHTS